MLKIKCFVVACAAIFAAAGGSSAPAQIMHYQLTNVAQGTASSLDVGNLPNTPHTIGFMVPTSTETGPFWMLTSNGFGNYRLSNTQVIGGVKVTNAFVPGRCLDVEPTTQYPRAMLKPCSMSASQLWTVALTGK